MLCLLEPRSAPRLGLAPCSGHLLYLRIETRSAHRLALVKRQSDIVKGGAIKLRAEQCPVGRLPLLVASPQRSIQRVRGHPAVRLAQSVRPVARPAIVRRVLDHRRTHRKLKEIKGARLE